MATHVETETQCGEPVHVTIVRNTIIARISFDGDERETWFVKEHGDNGVGIPFIEDLAAASTMRITHFAETALDDDGIEVEEAVKYIVLNFTQLGELAVKFSIVFEPKSRWGEVRGPYIGRAATTVPEIVA